jgi:hypothetical protein
MQAIRDDRPSPHSVALAPSRAERRSWISGARSLGSGIHLGPTLVLACLAILVGALSSTDLTAQSRAKASRPSVRTPTKAPSVRTTRPTPSVRRPSAPRIQAPRSTPTLRTPTIRTTPRLQGPSRRISPPTTRTPSIQRRATPPTFRTPTIRQPSAPTRRAPTFQRPTTRTPTVTRRPTQHRGLGLVRPQTRAPQTRTTQPPTVTRRTPSVTPRYTPRTSDPRTRVPSTTRGTSPTKTLRDRLRDSAERRIVTAPPTRTTTPRTSPDVRRRTAAPDDRVDRRSIRVPPRTLSKPTNGPDDRLGDTIRRRTIERTPTPTNGRTQPRDRVDTSPSSRQRTKQLLDQKLRQRYDRNLGRRSPGLTVDKTASTKPSDRRIERLPDGHRYRTPGRRGEILTPRRNAQPIVPDPLITVDRGPVSRNQPSVVGRTPRTRPSWRRTPRTYNWFVGSGFYPNYSFGSLCWAGHNASLSFAFGCAPRYRAWGIYSYPFYYGSLWPWSYHQRTRPFAYRLPNAWDCAPTAVTTWWWPNDCYYPGSWAVPTTYIGPTTTYVTSSVTIDSGAPDATMASTTVGAVSDSAELPASDSEDGTLAIAEKQVELGDYYFREGRYDEAAESWLRALGYVPDDASLHFVIADALFALGDYHYAAFMVRRALELQPELARVEIDKRGFYGDPSAFDEQLATVRAYLAEHPDDASAHLILGYSLLFSDQSAAAHAPFARVLELDPEDHAARLLIGSTVLPDASAREAAPERRRF